jgi:hypothetical protein
MISSFRRIVTGRTAEGRSVVAADTAVPLSPVGLADFWETADSPAPLAAAGDVDPAAPPLEPVAKGTLFRCFAIPPEEPGLERAEAERRAADAFARMQASHCQVDTARHPMMHTTRTIDYVMVLSGTVSLLLDEGEEVALAPFDVVVQRGTNHYWINHGREPAVLMAVLVDARAG